MNNGNGKKPGYGIKAQRSNEIEGMVRRLDFRDSYYLLGQLDYLNGNEHLGSYREYQIDNLLDSLYHNAEELLDLGIKGESYEVAMLDLIINAARQLLRYSGAENQRRYFEWKPLGVTAQEQEGGEQNE